MKRRRAKMCRSTSNYLRVSRSVCRKRGRRRFDRRNYISVLREDGSLQPCSVNTWSNNILAKLI